MQNSVLSTLSKLLGGGTAVASTTGRKDLPNKVAYLSAMRIFRDLSPEEMAMVEHSTVMTTAPKGKLIYLPGETGEVLFLLKRGAVHLYRLSAEGRKFIFQTIGPMTFFGEMAALGQNMHDLFAEAAEDSLVCVMGQADVERLILSKPQVALRMLEEVGQRMHEVQERLGDSAFKGVPARVAAMLLRLSQEGAQPISGLRHQDLADLLGLYRETVTNALDKLRDEGLVEIGRKEIVVLNAAELQAVAQEETLRRR